MGLFNEVCAGVLTAAVLWATRHVVLAAKGVRQTSERYSGVVRDLEGASFRSQRAAGRQEKVALRLEGVAKRMEAR